MADEVLGEHGPGIGDGEPHRDFIGREAVGDRNNGHTRTDDSQIDGHALRRHRHDDGNGVTGLKPHGNQPVGDTGRDVIEFGGRCHSEFRLTLLPRNDCRKTGFGIENAVGNVHPGAREPDGMLHAARQVQKPVVWFAKSNPQFPEGVLDERFHVGDAVAVQFVVGSHAEFAHPASQVG